MQPEIWFDVDDTLVDTASVIHQVMLEKTGQDIPVSKWSNLMFTEMYGLGLERVEEMRGWWKDHQLIERVEPLEGSIQVVRELSKQGYFIGLITARAWHPNAKALTEDFISKYDLPIDDLKLLKFDESKKDLLKSQANRIMAFVDDSASHVSGLAELGIPSALIRQPWNETHRHLPHLGSVLEMKDHFALSLVNKLEPLTAESLTPQPLTPQLNSNPQLKFKF